MFHLRAEEISFLKKLSTPSKVQDYLDSIPFNFEEQGETCMSARRVMENRKAHCLEGAFLACAAFLLQGRKPLILNLKVDRRDDDHVVALFKENGYWGAVSKTNHAVLRFRDPVYKNIRELAMSYFHEYFLVKGGEKTMKGFAGPINLRRYGTSWVASNEELWNAAEKIYDLPYEAAIPEGNEKYVREATRLEQKAAQLTGSI
jgi:hypothetical protein